MPAKRKVIDGKIKCVSCKQLVGLSNFRIRGTYKNGDPRPKSICRDCERDSNLKRYYTNYKGGNHRKACYRYTLITSYGLTEDEFMEMYHAQNGLCKICESEIGNPFLEVDGFRMAVDHCHDTGKVRGLLCTACNTGLGFFKDDVSLLKEAIRYLNEAYRGR